MWGQLCMYVCTGMANSPCSWCAGNISPPRLPPVDRRHLLPGHLLHGRTVAGAGVPCCARTGTRDRCGRAALCAHGRAMPVTRLRARRLNRADAQSSGEGAALPPLCADEAGESWSGRGHRGCTRRCLRAGVCTSVLGSLTRPAAGAQATCPPLACRRGTVVTCSRAMYPTVAPLQVRRRPSPRGFDCSGLARSFRGRGCVPRCARTGAARL